MKSYDGPLTIGDRIVYVPTTSGSAERWYVYGLVDPADGLVRYIGSTPYPVQRLAAHVKGDKYTGRRVRAWVRGVLDAGRYPYLEVMDVVTGGRLVAIAAEWRHIRRIGLAHLVNGQEVYRGRPKVMVAPDGLRTVQDIMRRLRVSRQRVHQLLRTRGIRTARAGDGRLLIGQDEADALIRVKRNRHHAADS